MFHVFIVHSYLDSVLLFLLWYWLTLLSLTVVSITERLQRRIHVAYIQHLLHGVSMDNRKPETKKN